MGVSHKETLCNCHRSKFYKTQFKDHDTKLIDLLKMFSLTTADVQVFTRIEQFILFQQKSVPASWPINTINSLVAIFL